jgi:hypothetical protein
VVEMSQVPVWKRSADAIVIMKLANDVTKLGEISKELRMKTLDVEREKAAAGHAGAGRCE